MEISFCYDSITYHQTTTNFAQGRKAAVSCLVQAFVAICSRKWMRPKWRFHRNAITMKRLLAKWGPWHIRSVLASDSNIFNSLWIPRKRFNIQHRPKGSSKTFIRCILRPSSDWTHCVTERSAHPTGKTMSIWIKSIAKTMRGPISNHLRHLGCPHYKPYLRYWHVTIHWLSNEKAKKNGYISPCPLH